MGSPQLDNLVRIRQLKAEPAQSLQLPPEQWRVLDQAHRKRNVAEYEGHLDVDRGLVEALIRVALDVAARIAALGPVQGR